MQGELNNQILIYQKEGKDIEIKLENETLWLDAHKIALLFGVNRPAIVKHINNIYKSFELSENQTCSKMEQVANDGKMRIMNLYNLDMIITVGYRVNSKQATQFRIWATNILKEYLTKGYSINESKILELRNKFEDLKKTITFIEEKSKNESLLSQSNELLSLLSSYSKTLTYLEKYDKGTLEDKKGVNGKYTLQYEECLDIKEQIKIALVKKNEASDLFGNEKDSSFEGIIKNIYQTFSGNELYEDIESKASHLLYFIIKDHPFLDGNKRIGAFLFIYFLDKNNYLYKNTGERKINDNALTALALLVAESKPNEKDIITKLIKNLITQS